MGGRKASTSKDSRLRGRMQTHVLFYKRERAGGKTRVRRALTKEKIAYDSSSKNFCGTQGQG